ncbi:SLC13 family permease [Maricaulis maris]|uniref:Sodium-dependent dicarboxylate transporter 2/3/5 n=1 Tax=Maricaulis maris TaxID=74318 RepID=A0A495CW40_9PROT|nr:SLC13 family permease [Maricaulis maris]RKQ89573.1 sodium-dependent dicarboxylate transporter 2/3/5 [Maricaulis maris]
MADTDTPAAKRGKSTSQVIGLFAGLGLAMLLQVLPLPDGLSREAWLLASLAVLMAVWWATEAIPIAATALIPMAIFPLLGIVSTGAATAPYASPIVMLLLGGFIVALSIERWSLHTRIALNIVNGFGGRPAALILGFMLASALLSMWISNTATTLMMIPIALRVAQEVEREGVSSKFFAPALALGVAYAASIGGMATPVGTPTNLIGIGYLQNEFDIAIDFATWMGMGLPIVALLIPVAWFILTRLAFDLKGGGDSEAAKELVRTELAKLGKMTRPEWRVALLFGTVAILWMGRVLPGELIGQSGTEWGWNPLLAWISTQLGLTVTLSLGNTQIAVMGALATFLVPAGDRGVRKGEMLMDWDGLARLPWNVVILFGGGLSLAAALSSTGLADWLGGQMGFLADMPLPVLLLIFVALVVFLTELTSNVATTTAFLPVLGVIAVEAGVPPENLVVPVAIAASTAFMLPVATAPNAIVYASGAVTQLQMMKAGVRINLAAIAIIAGIFVLFG